MPDKIIGNEVNVYLADYLKPRGIYLYASLAPQMEAYHKEGKQVMLIGVPGYILATNYPGATDGKVWSNLRGDFFATAEDLLAGRRTR